MLACSRKKNTFNFKGVSKKTKQQKTIRLLCSGVPWNALVVGASRQASLLDEPLRPPEVVTQPPGPEIAKVNVRRLRKSVDFKVRQNCRI